MSQQEKCLLCKLAFKLEFESLEPTGVATCLQSQCEGGREGGMPGAN